MLEAFKNNSGLMITLLLLMDFLLLAGVFVLFRQLSLLRRNVTILKRGVDGSSLLEKVASQALQIQDIYRILEQHATEKEYLTEVLAGSLQRVAVVRFDAFDDMGGKLSYSVAMLDENGDGVIFTSIYGRNENRTYAKAVKNGRASHVLSREEEEALRRALTVKPPMIRARKGGAGRLFNLESAVEDGGESRREEDGSWVM
ncbi:DUF4446 family protein [Candidatus Solincola sp.]|jgi:hypothetical protein|nr:DUF4446 family protein [Actinomycetota bacterium]MDI7251757.1 DUF4446 family protein [Actinomycetota bacterium]